MSAIIRDAATAREKIIQFIETIEDRRVISLYEFLKAEIDNDDWEYPVELKAQLDDVENDIVNNKRQEFVTQDEFKQYMKQKIGG
jgi:hypothetical protein